MEMRLACRAMTLVAACQDIVVADEAHMGAVVGDDEERIEYRRITTW